MKKRLKITLKQFLQSYEEHQVNPNFSLLDAVPDEPYDEEAIKAAMKELHARIERQAKNYGGKKHRFFPAQITKAA